MNATIAALVWCAIQVTVLTCGVAVVYFTARLVHPRAGAAAAGGGLLMVIALTALAASPWPRWTFTASDGAGVMRKVVAIDVQSQPQTTVINESSKGPVQETAVKPMDAAASTPSFWSLLVDAVNRPPRAMGSASESAAEAGATRRTWLIMSLFTVGGLVAAGRLAWGVSSVRRMAREARPVGDSRLLAMVHDLRQRLELAGAVDVRESDELATPATVGWRRPVVLLPPAWRAWSDAELRAVIAHELAHIAGRDYAAWFVARLAVVAHFYHPLVRWLATRLQLEQELAADMAAARLVGDPKQYLHSLAALALATPAHRMAGPARTLFPSRSLLVRRVEMLRTKGTSRPRRGAARYATFAMVAVVGLAAAGLRGPGVDLATSALAQAPPDALAPADEASKTKPAKPVERIDLEVVPPDAAFVLSVRPADLASHEDMLEVLKLFAPVQNMLQSTSLEITDVAEVLVMQYGKRDQAPSANTRIVVRLVTAADQASFRDAVTKQDGMIKQPGEAVWEPETRRQETARLTELDPLTLVVDQFVTNGKTPVALLKNALPAWNDVWKERTEQPFLFAVNVGPARQLLGGGKNPAKMFGEETFQTMYPLINDVLWAVANIELKEKIRVGGVFQTRGEKSAETVRETLQAAAVLLRNMARLYTNAQPQGPDGNPPSAAQSRLQKFIAGETDRLLGSAKFETDGDRVKASLQSTLSPTKLAELFKLALPSVEQARAQARQQVSMNNLKQLQLAMLNYESARRVFPSATSTKYRVGDEIRTSKFPHSWRIEVLPYLEQKALYDQYRFDEPWDSEANKKVLAQVPDMFRSPIDDPKSTNTSYFVLTGPQTVFPGEKDLPIPQGGGVPGERYGTSKLRDANDVVQPAADGRMRIVNITDGTSKTFSIVEAKREVPWTKPEDIEYAADKPVPKLGGWVPGEFLVALVDCSVHRVSTDIDEATLRAWITRNGREVGQELPRPKPR